jgi:Flp pilus assembly protein TadB
MSNNGSSNSGNGIGFGSLLFLTFLVLKLTHVIDWSWWWITAPLWGSLVALLVIFGVAFLVISARESSRKSRTRR